MKKSTLKSLSIFLILAGLAAASAQAQQGDQHMLWKIEKSGELQGYMIGSVHLMKPGIYPLDEVYQKAFRKSEIIVFELNLDSLKAKVRSLTRKLAVYTKGKTIKSELSQDTYTLLKNTLDSLGLPVARFSRIEPWFAAITLPSVIMARAGYSARAGIDIHFFQKAKKSNKQIVALETPAYQLNLFDDLSPRLQEKYLTYSLKHIDETLQNVEKLVTAWKHGNIQKLEAIMLGKMKKNFPELYHTIVTQRNKNWIPQITKLLSGSDTPLIIVGAGHMVGPTGLISLLEKRGYEVEQL